ncbi:MAG: potassium transporter Kup [Sphingobacteriales bacterium]|nr:MAG: potassium transporter Kup [Sphingobacteriales bacterium]
MTNSSFLNRFSVAGALISLGIVFGDIGTSPLYVMKAIVGNRPIHEELILGGISCVFWTLTFMTTIKYVLITLRADNRGEGGILSLYALVRRKRKWLVIPAIIGASTLLADGMITPPISVTSAIEGLKISYPQIEVVPIVLTIIIALFVFQRFGTQLVGRFFGPVMAIWFAMLGTLGISYIFRYPGVFAAINPIYVYRFLQEPGGFWLLGAVFLCTTGAEALYSDLGHCGRKNIQGSWVFVKICLLLNYFGQGAWLLEHNGQLLSGRNPFYQIMPDWFLLPGIVIATAATIIASQALITGSYTLISEAIRLNLWPKVKIKYPTIQRGQVYIPSINTILCIGCIVIVLYFRESERMEAAYGLAITLTMLVTTVLLGFYLRVKRIPRIWSYGIMGVFLLIEISFLAANLDKFPHGGWVSILIGFLFISCMWVWFKSRKIKNKYNEFVKLSQYLPIMNELSEDISVPKYATNLVFLTSADFPNEIEQKIIYSIFNKQPKRADVYWFLHVDVLDDPNTMEYSVDFLIPEKVIKIEFKVGFKVAPRINLFFRKAVEELAKNKEVNIMSRYTSLSRHDIIGDFRFVVIERILNFDVKLNFYDQLMMSGYGLLKKISISEVRAFGLDTSSVTTEKVPLFPSATQDTNFNRINR